MICWIIFSVNSASGSKIALKTFIFFPNVFYVITDLIGKAATYFFVSIVTPIEEICT
ncbi:hypothetical protein [Pedobacter segetis]|uniref:hypothetical protein n=1 Tax=Pedobacter segetis TaxID=2793069 RepID=UPI00374412DE